MKFENLQGNDFQGYAFEIYVTASLTKAFISRWPVLCKSALGSTKFVLRLKIALSINASHIYASHLKVFEIAFNFIRSKLYIQKRLYALTKYNLSRQRLKATKY